MVNVDTDAKSGQGPVVLVPSILGALPAGGEIPLRELLSRIVIAFAGPLRDELTALFAGDLRQWAAAVTSATAIAVAADQLIELIDGEGM